MVQREGTPQNYIIQSGTIIDGFESMDNWDVDAGAAEVSTDWSNTGSASVRMTTSTPGGVATIIQTGLSLDLSHLKNLDLSLYFDGDDSVPSTMTVMLSTTNDYSQYFRVRPTSTSYLKDGENRFLYGRDEIVAINGASWNDPILRIKITYTAATGKNSTIYFDSLRYNTRNKALCLLMMDDAFQSIIDGVEYANNKNIPITLYVIKTGEDGVDPSLYMTIPQLDDLYAAGNAIGNHSDTHPHMADESTENCITEINTCKEYLLDNGWERAVYHVAYPNTSIPTDPEAVAEATGSLSMRTSIGGGRLFNWPKSSGNLYRLGSSESLIDGITLDNVKTIINNAILEEKTCIFFGHKLAETAGQSTWASDDWESLIDYLHIKRSLIRCVTIDEWYNGLTDYRYQSIPVNRAIVTNRTEVTRT